MDEPMDIMVRSDVGTAGVRGRPPRGRVTTSDADEALSTEDLVVLRGTGALRAFVPERFSGEQDSVSAAVHRILDVATWNADAGWLAAVAAVTNLAVTELHPEALEEIWGAGADVLVAGTLAPAGSCRRSGDDVVVDATSAPASGLQHAGWVMASVVDRETSVPTRVVVPIGEVSTELTWDAFGLLGARGDTAHLEGVRVPARRRRALGPAEPGAPLTFFATLFFASAVVGAARSASRSVVQAVDAGAAPRWRRPDVRSATSAAVRRVHRAGVLLEGAVAALGPRSAVDAMDGRERALAADAAVTAVGEAEAAVPELIGAFGPGGLAPAHPLARAFRDVTTGARHTALSRAKAALAHESALFEREPWSS